MSSLGRNGPCPCGSGKKYKKCCLKKDEAAADARSATEQIPPSGPYAPMLAEDDLDELSNGVLDLIDEGRLDAAEARARDLLERYPDVIDGLARLGAVYEARGDTRAAAKYYREAAHFADTHDGYDPEVALGYRETASRLERG
jgi:tetratricopeptide (TPR) repeat protein